MPRADLRAKLFDDAQDTQTSSVQSSATPVTKGRRLCDRLLLPPQALGSSPGHAKRGSLSLSLALLQSHRHSAEAIVVSHCPLPPARPCMAPSLPIGRHFQAEAGLHVHELLIVPQPVGHGQGESRLLILQAGNRALKGTDWL